MPITSIGNGGWTRETPAGHTAIAAADGGLQMLVDSVGQVWAKDSIGDGGWTRETPAGHTAIAAGGGGLQMLLDSVGQVWAKDSMDFVTDLSGTGTVTADFPVLGVSTLNAPIAMTLKFTGARDQYVVQSMNAISIPLRPAGSAILRLQSGSGTFNDPAMTMTMDFVITYTISGPCSTVNDFKTNLSGSVGPVGGVTLAGTGRFGPVPPFDATAVHLTAQINPRP